MLLPEKYFTLEGCDREKDKDCNKAREDYLKSFGEVDIPNGYIKGGCDGGQACMEMAIFKRPDGTYLVGLATSSEMLNDNYFLKLQERPRGPTSLPRSQNSARRICTNFRVRELRIVFFAKKIIEQGPDYEASEKG
jgi:hypothetical protein